MKSFLEWLELNEMRFDLGYHQGDLVEIKGGTFEGFFGFYVDPDSVDDIKIPESQKEYARIHLDGGYEKSGENLGDRMPVRYPFKGSVDQFNGVEKDEDGEWVASPDRSGFSKPHPSEAVPDWDRYMAATRGRKVEPIRFPAVVFLSVFGRPVLVAVDQNEVRRVHTVEDLDASKGKEPNLFDAALKAGVFN